MDDVDALRLAEFAERGRSIFQDLDDWQIFCGAGFTEADVSHVVDGVQNFDDLEYRRGVLGLLSHAMNVGWVMSRADDQGFSQEELKHLWAVLIEVHRERSGPLTPGANAPAPKTA